MLAKKAKIVTVPKEVMGLDDNDFYTEAGIHDCSDDDEISLEEEAFMFGYLSA